MNKGTRHPEELAGHSEELLGGGNSEVDTLPSEPKVHLKKETNPEALMQNYGELINKLNSARPKRIVEIETVDEDDEANRLLRQGWVYMGSVGADKVYHIMGKFEVFR